MQYLAELIKDINNSGKEYILAITGGGIQSLGELLRYGGGSATCIEMIVPYHPNSLQEFLKYKPAKACSEETARKMALRSFQKALGLGVASDKAGGFGVTCSLARGSADGEIRADGSRREHWVHIAYQDRTMTWVYSMDLTNSGMSRVEEENEVADLVVKHIHNFLCGHDSNAFEKSIKWPMTDAGNMSDPPLEVQELMCGNLNIARALGGKRGTLERITEFDGEPYSRDISKLIYSGSFNPVHHGHIGVATIAAIKTGERPTFEISIENPDKPPLDYIDMDDRFCNISIECASSHLDYENVIFTRLPLFKDKMMALPVHTFVMGADTAIRFCDEKYGSVAESLEALDKSGCHVIITERQGFDLKYVKGVMDMFNRSHIGPPVHFVPESLYKDDGVSSSQLRNSK